MKKLSITTWILIALFAGIFAGWLIGEPITIIAKPLADIFIRLLRMAIMPLVITSILSGVLSIGSAKGLGRLGLKTFLYYTTTTILAIITGQILVNLLKPGVGAEIGLDKNVEHIAAAEQSVQDMLIRIIPTNPFESMAKGDVLPVIFFCIFFGYFITQLQEPHKSSISNVIEAAFQAMMKMTHFIIWFAPLGVFGINAEIVATTGIGAFKALGFYFLIVLIGLLWHAFINLPLLLKFFAKVSPLAHFRNMTSALLTAFTTSSSMVALPLNLECVTQRSKVSQKIANFTLPIGATVNMDGTALYECVATIFIAQVYGIELGFSQQILVVLTALLASIGAAAVPMAGLVMMSIILQAVGLPLEGMAIVMAVDRILDMFRTATNVWSDSCGAVIIGASEGESLDNLKSP